MLNNKTLLIFALCFSLLGLFGCSSTKQIMEPRKKLYTIKYKRIKIDYKVENR